jgi:hypothetical protein
MKFTTAALNRTLTVRQVLGLLILIGLAGCGAKGMEPFKDAKVSERNDGPAVIGTMPDGFGNWSMKCNGKVGVYTLYHHDAAYGGIAVLANDPNCP